MKTRIFFKSIIFLLFFLSQQLSARHIVCYNIKGSSRWDCYFNLGSCGGANLSPGLSSQGNVQKYCRDLMIKPGTPPIIRTDLKGNAFLDNNGQVVRIASDKAIVFWEKNANPTAEELETFIKTDDGIVSIKRLEAIAKELNAKIVKSFKPITANYCPPCEENPKGDTAMVIKGKHTCLICGGKHKGKCKKMYTEENATNISIAEETLNCKCCGKEVKGTFGENISHTKTCCKTKDSATKIAMQEEITATYIQGNGNAKVECLCCGTTMDISKVNQHARTCCPKTHDSQSLQSGGKHTCLICGGKHKGKCKKMYTEIDENILSSFSHARGSGGKEYYDGETEDCKAKKGVECTDEIAVTDDFDAESFDKYISTNDPQRIKDIFIKNDMAKFLPGIMKLSNGAEIIERLKTGELTLKIIPNKKELYLYQLGTPKNVAISDGTVKVQLSAKKPRRTGHVTLLK